MTQPDIVHDIRAATTTDSKDRGLSLSKAVA